MTAEQPKMGEVLLHNGTDWLEMPDVPSPYYILAKDGPVFIHRRTAQGRGLVPTNKNPFKDLRQMPETGFPNGNFLFDGAVLPASIYAQAVHFFRRIFEKYGTEAEVIITQNEQTKEYRLFVPTQSVSHGGVYSIYNPEHIERGYIVIGTFHSHCDFSSFHSGTDEGDARDMDGLHGTIGYVNRDVPELSLMYALNKRFFHFAHPFTGVVDINDLNAGTAPEWWDRYVLTTKPTDADRQRIAPYADDESWDRFMGRPKWVKPTQIPTNRAVVPTNGKHTPLTPQERAYLQHWFDSDEDYFSSWDGDYRTGILSESAEFNRRRDPRWGKDGELLPADARELGRLDEDFWEDKLGRKFLDELFNTELITEQDAELAIDNPDKSGTEAYWEGRMRNKLFRAVAWLRHRGIEVTVRIDDNRIKPVPGQTTMTDMEQVTK